MKTTISQIGSFAQQVLERSSSALVTGIASRGIYLQPGDDWTLYLSLEEYRAPLTLNLADGSISLSRVKAGAGVQLSPQEITFEDGNLTITLKDSSSWHPPRTDHKIQLKPDQLASLHPLARKITPDHPYLPLLSERPDQIPGVPVIGERILNLQKAIKERDQDQLGKTAISLLGLGPGLTPLGDDFLLGVLLTLNRWGNGFAFSRESIKHLNQTIINQTRVKTTRISSSLLICAVEGTADERLIAVLDELCSGKGITKKNLKNLLRWGNTSGITVLAGMMTALS